MPPLDLRVDPSVGDPLRFREGPYLRAVLAAAHRHAAWPSQISCAVVLSAHRRHTRWPALETAPNARLVVALGNEDGTVRPELLRASTVLAQHYLPPSTPPDAHLVALPLGPGGPTPTVPALPWSQRDLDLVFVGHLHQRRWPLARKLGMVHPAARGLPNRLLPAVRAQALVPFGWPGRAAEVAFTARFGGGRSHTDYLRLLSRARIALVPPGFKQDETFRHHEAARAGCVLVGTPLPDARYPVLRPPADRPLLEWLDPLLDRPEVLHAHHLETLRAWRSRGSPAAVGARLAADVAARVRACAPAG